MIRISTGLKLALAISLSISFGSCNDCEHDVDVRVEELTIVQVNQSDSLKPLPTFALNIQTDLFAYNFYNTSTLASFGPFGCEEQFYVSLSEPFWLEDVRTNSLYNQNTPLIECFSYNNDSENLGFNEGLALIMEGYQKKGVNRQTLPPYIFALNTKPTFSDTFQFTFTFKDARDSVFKAITEEIFIAN